MLGIRLPALVCIILAFVIDGACARVCVRACMHVEGTTTKLTFPPPISVHMVCLCLFNWARMSESTKSTLPNGMLEIKRGGISRQKMVGWQGMGDLSGMKLSMCGGLVASYLGPLWPPVRRGGHSEGGFPHG